MNQESESNQCIKEFVQKRFSSGFNLFGKTEVNGPSTHPVYLYLRRYGPLWNEEEQKAKQIPWSFSKFLLNEEGEIIKFGNPTDAPESFRKDIEELLK